MLTASSITYSSRAGVLSNRSRRLFRTFEENPAELIEGSLGSACSGIPRRWIGSSAFSTRWWPRQKSVFLPTLAPGTNRFCLKPAVSADAIMCSSCRRLLSSSANGCCGGPV